MNVSEAAARLNLDESTVYRLCRARKIRHRRIGAGGGRISFTEDDLQAYLDSCVVEVVTPEDSSAPPPPVRLKYVRAQGARRA